MEVTKDLIQNEALEALLKHDRSSVSITVGGGKTLLGLKYVDYYFKRGEFRVLVVAPKKSIFQSWKDDIVKFNMNHLEGCFSYSTYLSLYKNTLDYDIVILDEMHSLIPDSHEEWLSMYSGKILGLTGTEPKGWTNRGKLIAQYCPIRFTYTTDEAVEDQILNDYRIIVHRMGLDKAKTIKKKTRAGGFWMTSEQSEYDYWTNRISNANSAKETQITRIMRMKSLQGFTSKERYAKQLFNTITEKAILFANTQDQAELLCDRTYHSKNPVSNHNLELFKSGKISKLACVLQISEGINIPGLKEGIILHSYGNNVKSSQRIGRLLRLNPDDVATAHILCYTNTVDETWVKEALKGYDQTKITYK